MLSVHFTSVSCAESENVTGIRPSFFVPGLNDHLVLGRGSEAIKYKVASVCESVAILGARSGVFNRWDNVCPFNGLLGVEARRGTAGLSRAGVLIRVISVMRLKHRKLN